MPQAEDVLRVTQTLVRKQRRPTDDRASQREHRQPGPGEFMNAELAAGLCEPSNYNERGKEKDRRADACRFEWQVCIASSAAALARRVEAMGLGGEQVTAMSGRRGAVSPSRREISGTSEVVNPGSLRRRRPGGDDSADPGVRSRR
ncbi:hypothetical protein MRX96_014691 [Rhipicephalus microplus]